MGDVGETEEAAVALAVAGIDGDGDVFVGVGVVGGILGGGFGGWGFFVSGVGRRGGGEAEDGQRGGDEAETRGEAGREAVLIHAGLIIILGMTMVDATRVAGGGCALMMIYSLLLVAVLVVGAPYWLVRMAASGRYRAGLMGRLGRVPAEVTAAGDAAAGEGRPMVWVHAVSVGEVLAATAMVGALKDAGLAVAVSTTTQAGQELAKKRLGSGCAVFYMPLDFGVVVRRYLAALRPRLVVNDGERALAECDSGVQEGRRAAGGGECAGERSVVSAIYAAAWVVGSAAAGGVAVPGAERGDGGAAEEDRRRDGAG